MLWIDRKYINLIGSQLEQFKQKKPDLWNFRCPECGDSKKNTFKARCYIYRKDNSYFVRCHNCGYSHIFPVFLKDRDSALYSQYRLEVFKEKEPIKAPEPVIPKQPVFTLKTIPLATVESLDTGHWVKDYIRQRLIPEPFWSDLYYAPDYKEFVDSFVPEHGKNLKEGDPRIVIPMRKPGGELIGFQGRMLSNFASRPGNDYKAKYITIKLDENSPKVYGLDKLNINDTIYVFEGPFDSMFLPNAMATCDSDLQRAGDYLPKENLMLVFDCQPRNKQITKTIHKAIKADFNVCLLPKNLPGKDINEMIQNGCKPDKIQSIIDENTFKGIRAEAQFINWKEI